MLSKMVNAIGIEYPKFRISRVYDFLECEKRFFLLETGQVVKRPTIQMKMGSREHAKFEEVLMKLPEAEKILNLKDGFVKSLDTKKTLLSSEIPLELKDHDFRLFVKGKMDCVIILPEDKIVRIIENKPRLSEYAILQGILYGYVVKRLLQDFSPRIEIEIRNTSSQEILDTNIYKSNEEDKARKVLERVGKLLNKEVDLNFMKKCSRPECHCNRVWW